MGRAIDQDGVIALIDLKVASLQEKLNESFNPDGSAEREWKAKISAMNAVKGHLKFIEDYKFPTSRPLHELIAEDEQKAIDKAREGDFVLRDTVTGRYYADFGHFVENPRDAFIFHPNNKRVLQNTQEMVPYSEAIKPFANPRPLPPEVAMIEEIEQAEQRSK